MADRESGELAHRWVGDMWAEPSSPGGLSLDTWFVSHPDDDVCRVGVFDAAAPPAADHRRLVELGGELCDVFERAELTVACAAAGELLCDPLVRPRQANPLFAAAVVDVSLADGSVRAVCAADCEVWVRRGGVWVSLFADDMLLPAAREAWTSASAQESSQQRWAAQFDVLDDPALWRRAPLGMVAAPACEPVSATGVDGVVVSSDGARLTADRCADLDGWLRDGIHDVPDDWPHPSPHGDLCVVRLERT